MSMPMEGVSPIEASNLVPSTQKKEGVAKRVQGGVKKSEEILGVYSNTIGPIRALAMATQPANRALAQGLAPLRGVALFAAPFEFVHVVVGIKEAVQAPGALKVLPLLKVSNAVGGILDHFAAAVSISETLGATGIQGLVAATGPIVVAAAALQVAGIAITAWNLHELRKQWDQVMTRLGKKDDPNHEPTLEEYKAAVDFLNAQPTDRKEKFKQAFFGILTKGQKEKIQKIYEKATTGKPDKATLNALFDRLKTHVTHQKVQKALTIAILIIGIVGVLLLVFSPTPLAPLAWVLLATTGIASLGMLAYMVACSRQLNRSLLKLLEKS